MWTGASTGHITKMDRKPTSLGYLVKTLVDSDSGILMNAEISEGAEIDRKKEFTDQYGATTATTLRLCKPWWGSGRTLVGDAWFGSYKCAYQLLERGVFSVMNVKNNSKRFPKKELQAAV